MKKRRKTFTKKLVKWVMAISLFDLQLSYLLAFLGRVEIAENLSMTVVTTIIGTVITYCIKSFKETKEEERLRYEKEKDSVWTNKEGEA
ncbi:hypothetical protein H9X85_10705 [Anaerotignum lactatifermentans]|uniref:Holin n=1 Tax=Anaerotignum lactatifermentans TaxID=160404 RepID=A0ABS2GD39_9FIRM|nr:hypothetical protein [Anaerotignum lactatifermentans]MBM6830028.1 hypothetical protein [Anaerotignum lactatifermentans]MBM6878620.1 hypothetical protein [Anaerotignum lactatifermentans]MBM6951667.1 hypothetical protein [Anaerotignum lactatifermentans]